MAFHFCSIYGFDFLNTIIDKNTQNEFLLNSGYFQKHIDKLRQSKITTDSFYLPEEFSNKNFRIQFVDSHKSFVEMIECLLEMKPDVIGN